MKLEHLKAMRQLHFIFILKNANITSVDIFPDLIRYESKRIKNFFLDNSQENQIERKKFYQKICLLILLLKMRDIIIKIR